MLQTRLCRVKTRIIKQVHGTEHLTQSGEFRLRPYINSDPVVITTTRIHIVRRMPAMPIPLGGGIASVHRILHDEFAEGGQEAFRQWHLNELSFPCVFAVS